MFLKAALLFIFIILNTSSLFSRNREPFYPYITGDAFRALAQHILDEDLISLDVNNVCYGDVIFVKTDFLDKFFQEYHPYIKESYILISHNSDYEIPGLFASYLEDSKILAWFGQNVVEIEHPKLIPIPIGLPNQYIRSLSESDKIISCYSKIHKTNLVYLNVNNTHPERVAVYNCLKNLSICKIKQNIPYKNYMHDVARSIFVISPRGNGWDCHRTWEILYLNSIPIVKSSKSDSLFDELPVLIIQDWNELTEEFLIDQKSQLDKRNFNMSKMHMEYWQNKISSYRLKIEFQQ